MRLPGSFAMGLHPSKASIFSNSSSAISLTAVHLWESVCFSIHHPQVKIMIFFFIYMMVYFSLQKKHLHVFTYYISKSQHGESASVLHTNKKKKKKMNPHKNSQRCSTMYDQLFARYGQLVAMCIIAETMLPKTHLGKTNFPGRDICGEIFPTGFIFNLFAIIDT